MSFIEFRRYWRNKATGEVDSQLWKLFKANKTITLDRSYVYSGDTCKASPFAEYETVNPLEQATDATKEALTLTRGYVQVTLDDAIDQCIKVLSDILLQYWSKDKYHVVLASGGYDSRILLALIRRLGLSDYLLITNRFERQTFEQLVKATGEKNYLIYADGQDDMHFSDSLYRFDEFYKEVNAPCPIPGNQWWYLVRHAQEKGLLPESENLQLLGGYWHNELVECFLTLDGGAALNPRFLSWYPYHVMASLPQKAADILFPFAHIDYIRLLASFYLCMPNVAFRKAISDKLIPSLSDVSNQSLSDVYVKMSSSVIDRTKQIYSGSWYGKVKPNINPVYSSEFSNWWSDYSLASLCEYGIKIGANLR